MSSLLAVTLRSFGVPSLEKLLMSKIVKEADALKFKIVVWETIVSYPFGIACYASRYRHLPYTG